jgi:dTDP-4-dehydrorhamnose reductase
MENRKKRILITGAGGMLGQDLVAVLSQDKDHLFGLGRKKRLLKKMVFFQCDLLDTKRVEKIVKRIKPQIVIHAAAKTQVDACETKPKEAYLQNVAATYVLVRACRPLKPFMIYMSSDYVYGGDGKQPIKEGQKEAPINVYGATKWLGETLVRHSGCPYAILRTSWLFGAGGANFIKAILKISESKNKIKVVSDQMGAPTWTRDLAYAIRTIIKEIKSGKKIQGIYHITNRGVTNWKKFAEEILDRAGRSSVTIAPIKTRDYERPANRPKNSVLSNLKYQQQFRFRLRPWQEALDAYLVSSSSYDKAVRGKTNK